MANNTGNPIGSDAYPDFQDNVQNLDHMVAGEALSWADRFGKQRKSWTGIESDFDAAQDQREDNFNSDQSARDSAFQNFLEGSGWSVIGDYAAGISIVSHTQAVNYNGQPYSLKPSIPASVENPYVTNGDWSSDGGNFKLVGDNNLRQELSGSGQNEGSELVGYKDPVAPAYLKTVSDIINADTVSVMRFIDSSKHAALYAGTSTEDFTANVNEALAVMRDGGELTVPVKINTVGLEIANSKNLKITGYGWGTGFKNNSQSGAHDLWIRGDNADDRTYGLDISCLTFEGNPNSGNGLQLDRLGWYDVGNRQASVANLTKIQVLNSGQNGIQVGKSSTEGAGNSTNIEGSAIRGAGRTGILGIGQTNLIYVGGCNIALCKRDGVEFNQVASTNTVDHCLIADNTRYGVFAFRCEEPIITRNGFNRNMQGAVVLSGDPTGSVKFTEAALIFGNLFGDNGRNAPIGSKREVQLYATKSSNIIGNYFYGTGQETMIYLSDYCEGIAMSGNHFKDLTTETMLQVKAGAVNTTYTFDDDVDESLTRNIISNKVMQHIRASGTTLLQIRNAVTDAAPRFLLDANGGMRWGPGSSASDVGISRGVAGAITVAGGLQAARLMVQEGLPLPNAATGYASLFVDAADGKLKIRFSSGVTSTIQVV